MQTGIIINGVDKWISYLKKFYNTKKGTLPYSVCIISKRTSVLPEKRKKFIKIRIQSAIIVTKIYVNNYMLTIPI